MSNNIDLNCVRYTPFKMKRSLLQRPCGACSIAPQTPWATTSYSHSVRLPLPIRAYLTTNPVVLSNPTNMPSQPSPPALPPFSPLHTLQRDSGIALRAQQQVGAYIRVLRGGEMGRDEKFPRSMKMPHLLMR